MNILHIIIGLNIGGAERSLQRLIEAHRNNPEYQHTVISLTTTGKIGEELTECGIKVIPLGMTSFLSSPVIFLKLITAIKKQQPDIVHTWMYHADLMGGLAAWLLRKKVIWSVRNTHTAVEKGTSKVTFYIMRLCAFLSPYIPQKILCVANAAATTHEKYGYQKSKMAVIPNGYNLEKIQSASISNLSRGDIQLDEKSIIIGSVGRFNDYKDFPTFINAAKIFLKQHSNLQFLLVGRDLNQHNKLLNKWIAETNAPEKFILLDERKDVPALMKLMDIFCLHSASEGFPNVLGEAMCLGLPCVTTDAGDAAFIIGNHPELIVPTRNPESLAKALQQLILLTPTQRKQLGSELSERIATEFSIEKTITAYENIYQEILCAA